MFIQWEVSRRGENREREKNTTCCTRKGFVLRHCITVVARNGRMEEESVGVLSSDSALECSRVFYNRCWRLLLIRRESGWERASGFESVVDPLQGHAWSNVIVTRGSGSPFLCARASGAFTSDCTLGCSPQTPLLYPSHLARSQVQRVSLPGKPAAWQSL